MKNLAFVMLLVVLSACGGESPFSGPLYDSDSGKITSTNDTLVVAVTLAKLGDDRLENLSFWQDSVNVVSMLEQQPGFVGYAVGGSLWDGEALTMTVWQDEASLDAFVKSKEHREAIKNSWDAVVDAKFVRMTVPRDQAPLTWEQARQLLAEKGQPSFNY